MSLEVASRAPTKKKSEAPQALQTRFFARLGRFGARPCSPKGPQDTPGLDFGPRNGCCFEVFACGKRSRRKLSDIDVSTLYILYGQDTQVILLYLLIFINKINKNIVCFHSKHIIWPEYTGYIVIFIDIHK